MAGESQTKEPYAEEKSGYSKDQIKENIDLLRKQEQNAI
jgi:hypothetical protein